MIVAFYAAYTVVRDLHATAGGLAEATAHAVDLVRVERAVDLFHEQWLQHQVVGWKGFVEFWNSYYGTVHFLAVAFVLVVLYTRDRARYQRWRNILALTTGLSLVGFALFPVAPPRLLPASYHFVDTLAHFDGVWNFSHGPIARASNQYAAMPSLHSAWSTWCALAAMPLVRPRWARWLVASYPVVTLFGIVVTGNHYFVDAAAGAGVVALSWALARLVAGPPDAAVTGSAGGAGGPVAAQSRNSLRT